MIDPVVMLCVDKKLKMSFNFLICAFCLTIRLWVIGCGKDVGDIKLLIQSLYKTGCKLRFVIGNDL